MKGRNYPQAFFKKIPVYFNGKIDGRLTLQVFETPGR
jgi:hypothetical protein